MTVLESLTNTVNSGILTFENHTNDNSFVSTEFFHFEKDFLHKGYEPVGVCKNIPYNNYDSPMIAYVFKDNDETVWIHMPERCLVHLLSDNYGREKAKELVKNL